MSISGAFIGLCGMDIVYYSSAPLPKENSKITTDCFIRQIGGPAANAAITFAALGNEAVLYSFVGYDDAGKWIEEKLKKYGVKLIRLFGETADGDKCGKAAGSDEKTVLTGEHLPDSDISSIYVNTADGTRTIFSGRTQRNMELISDIIRNIAETEFILYDGNLPGIEHALMDYVNHHDIELVLDAGSFKEGFLQCFSKGTTAIASESFKTPSGEDIFFYRKLLKECAVTRGEKSILYDDGGGGTGEIEVGNAEKPDSEKDNTVSAGKDLTDTLAAGDIFHGAYCHFRYADKIDFAGALKKASEIASASVKTIGTEEFFDRLMLHKR